MKYYPINENMARRAKEANSFFDYLEGSATHEYHAMVDRAYQIAEDAKAAVDPMYHEKIDHYADMYARKLADNLNRRYEIDTRVPSILIAGGAGINAGKKEKQNAARDKNMAEYNEIQDILHKMQSVGHAGIMSDDKDALIKLRKKLEGLERLQDTMKAVNAYYRKHKTLDGAPLTSEQGESLKAAMGKDWRVDPKPFPTFELTNNGANIRRIKQRIEALEKEQAARREAPAQDEQHEGYTLKENTEIGRIQFLFDGKPDDQTRATLKSYGFRWAPSEGAWQRMLNDNGRYAAKQVIKQIGG